MDYIIVSNKDKFFKKYEKKIYELRYTVFKEILNWNVITFDKQEKDCFDELETVFFVLVIDEDDNLLGCKRLLPTTHPYMLEKVFPQLFDELIIPKEKNVWELSRFSINPHFQQDVSMMSFNKVTLLLIKGICDFAMQNNIDYYLAVTTDRMRRLVKKMNMDADMIGKKIKIENTNVITLKIMMNEQSFMAIDYALNTLKK